MAEKLEKARKELLDLGLRNPLLNYRSLRARGLEIVGEKPVSVFRILVREGKTMSFVPTKGGDKEGLFEQPDELSEEAKQVQYDDLRLQTPYDSARLRSRLLTTYQTSRTFIEEQGVNTLYLALGMLGWYDAESSQEKRRAPLVLIPVELERANAKERFHISYTGEEIGANLSLAAKLKSEFGIDLPPFPDTDELDLPTYFTAIEQVIEGQPRWSVERDVIALSLFSFSKFLMFHDLDEANWAETAKPSGHALIKALLQEGFREPPLTITEDDHLDQHIRPLDLNQVVEADSSQTLAILAASQGRNLIIQGPPGTGKSQTITNLIAEAIGKGKKVLFVAEKKAAREVVKRRLDKIGLGDACLELHDTNKKALLSELAHTLNLGKPMLKSIEGEIGLLTETQHRLNSYCEAVNTTISSSGVTPYDAYGGMLKIRQQYPEAKLPQFNLPEMTLWKDSEYHRKRAITAEMQHRLVPIGTLKEHPFRGSKIKVLMPSEQERLEDVCLVAWQSTARLRDRGRGLANLLGLPIPQVRKDIEVLCRAARRAMDAPGLQGVQLRTGDWQARRDEIRTLLTAGLRLSQLHARFDAILISEAWEQDLLETRQHLVNYGNKWWRLLSGNYRRARNRLAGLCQIEAPKEIEKKIELVDAVLEARRQQAMVREFQNLGATLFGAQWQGEKSDWRVLAKLFEWIIALYKDIGDGQLPEGLLIFLAGNPRVAGLESAITDVETALNIHSHHARAVASSLNLDEQIRFGANEKLEDQVLETQEKLFEDWSIAIPRLHEIAAFNLQAETLQKEGLVELLRMVDGWPNASQHLVIAFEWNWFEKLLTKAFFERQALAAFQGESQMQAVNQFCQLDRLVTEHNRLRLASLHWQRLPQQNGSGQIAVLRRELEKKSRHFPIRKLMKEAGNAIQAIKPVFMMSPLSIANYLAPDSINFDLVVFDEASQVKPVDALGAILRGKQIVVVGDSKQMPPTNFFDSIIQGGDGDEENESTTANIESILGLCKAQGMPERMLRWHYRSRHESLIAVSNYEFYENRLIVFPGNPQQSDQLGLLYHHLPQTIYDKGKSTTNAQEATFVAQAVMNFARSQLRRPSEEQQSLLVAAFSVAQKKAIWDQLEMLRRQDTSCEEFFAPGKHEPFDVKNLENVQGDERDVIFISIGYGRDETGQVSMNFGPLNRDGGERRLNVLITRARRRCEIFTNLTDQDIDLTRTNSRGVRALKSFLAYARTKQLDIPLETGRGTDSPFEDSVKAALESEGYQVRTQVGSAGFFIDLAIVDTKRPGAYLLGIECDGAMYHSSRSARDRDRLRQQILEGLGWRIHRIWSTDWFRNPARELKRVVTAIQEAQAQGGTSPVTVDSAESPTSIERTVVEYDSRPEAITVAQPYQIANFSISLMGYELHTVRRDLLASWVIEVVKVESPVHINEVARRITNAAGLVRVGNRIKDAIESACSYATRTGAIRRQGEFLWTQTMTHPVIRERSNLPASSRKIELVAPEELALAIEQVVRNSFGIQRESVGVEVLRIFGFSRTSDEMRSAVEIMVDRLLANGRLKQIGLHLTVSNPS
ncbi:MAG: DUF3320 domain-containing protein [Acidobacteria bacterium]|nr:DUF3320 domain-containing protein [Acidobacteriota bacterium]